MLGMITRQRPYFNPADQRIADYILHHSVDIKNMTIKTLASHCEVSESSISRFVKTLGIASYQMLKILIAEEVTIKASSTETEPDKSYVFEDISDNDSLTEIVEKLQHRYLSTVNDVTSLVNSAKIDAVVELIAKADVIAFFGIGSSTLAVENALMRFMRVGKRCIFFRDNSMFDIVANTLGANSLAIAISNSGESIPVVSSLKTVKEAGAATVCITSFPDASLVKYSDIALFTPTTHAPTGNHSARLRESMISKVAQMYLVDILYCAYAVTHFNESVHNLEKTDKASIRSRHKQSKSK
ncbi:Uncharacterized HTH-type transcriptional regulator ybbH [Leminorella richardii]|uniref:Uncharacterized HTH-type transcriptional regulator ybbH n=1 Tax=Leminorella richardii TaxID=158841 RepID=A0A2X4UC94_9GAMM|nr:Uncharacterized HTH-type transcriptional regulator ybbH [Leminorella richardii]